MTVAFIVICVASRPVVNLNSYIVVPSSCPISLTPIAMMHDHIIIVVATIFSIIIIIIVIIVIIIITSVTRFRDEIFYRRGECNKAYQRYDYRWDAIAIQYYYICLSSQQDNDYWIDAMCFLLCIIFFLFTLVLFPVSITLCWSFIRSFVFVLVACPASLCSLVSHSRSLVVRFLRYSIYLTCLVSARLSMLSLS